MGSSGSKAASSSPSPASSSSGRRGGSRGNKVFQSFCLRTSPSGSHDTHNDDQVSNEKKGYGSCAPCKSQIEKESNQLKIEHGRKVKARQSDETPFISSNVELDEYGQENIAGTASRTPSSSVGASSMGSFNPSSPCHSRFSFIPGDVSFRLSRATSLGSSMTYPVPSPSVTILNNEEELLQRPGPASRLVNRNETQQVGDLITTSLISRSHTQCYEDTSGNLRFNTPQSGSSDNLQDEQTVSSSHDVARDDNSSRMGADVNLISPRIHTEVESTESRFSDRWTGAREPVERNVRFSRTLSVGRLRDRVLRRSPPLSDFTICPLLQEREVRDVSQANGRHTRGSETGSLASDDDGIVSPTTSGYLPSSISSSVFSNQDYEVENSRSREARYRDLLEHRSTFLERRRRIRSQVRALQQLGSRFENLSGHERSCILTGQHRTGRCTCRISNQNANSNDDTSARASISRIVILAEALFEVLDEIHEQSVVLSSQPSVSSMGSVPAPNEVVESLPVKLYSKGQKYQNEEAAQCYICLGEYEEGDNMRILPCNHEFHRTCIDKWLKEIHRVCPLCRGDICRSDSLPAEN